MLKPALQMPRLPGETRYHFGMNLLESPFVAQVRRNHGLEHATIHVLTERFRPIHLAGRATENGFFVYGNVSTEDVLSAALEALSRFNKGETHWAVHPGCGTNVVTTGVLAGLGAFLMLSVTPRRAPWWDKLPSAMLGAMGGALGGAYAGPWMLANVTTSADMRNMSVSKITRQQNGKLVAHFVRTQFAN
jgi:hypothetical protein